MSSAQAGDRVLSLHEVETLTSLSKSALYRLIAIEQFPRQFRISSHRCAWLASEVQAWLEAKCANRGGVQ